MALKLIYLSTCGCFYCFVVVVVGRWGLLRRFCVYSVQPAQVADAQWCWWKVLRRTVPTPQRWFLGFVPVCVSL